MSLEQASSSDVFDSLVESVDERLAEMQDQISVKVKQGAFEAAQELLQSAQELSTLRDDLSSIAARYERLVAARPAEETGDRLPRGRKTPQAAYRVPILRALTELGGEARMGQVLERVRELVADQLNEYDLSTLSDGKTVRWRNTAQWARNAMREEGLIRDDSPYGTWAISEKGRRWLKSNVS